MVWEGVGGEPVAPGSVDGEGARGAACLNSRPQPGAKTFGGLEGGGVGGLAGQPPGSPGAGSVGTATYPPQNDPHDALIILNIHNWGKKNCPLAQAPISQGPTSRSGRGSIFFLCFSPQNSEYFEYRHIG